MRTKEVNMCKVFGTLLGIFFNATHYYAKYSDFFFLPNLRTSPLTAQTIYKGTAFF